MSETRQAEVERRIPAHRALTDRAEQMEREAERMRVLARQEKERFRRLPGSSSNE